MENIMKEKINNFLMYQKQHQDVFTNYTKEKEEIEKEKDYIDDLLNFSGPIYGLDYASVIKKELSALRFDKSDSRYWNSLTVNSNVFKKLNKFQFPNVNSINLSIDENIKDRLAIEEEESIEEIHSLRNKWQVAATKLEQQYNQSMKVINKSVSEIKQAQQEQSDKKKASTATGLFGVLTFFFFLIGVIGFFTPYIAVGIIGLILFFICLIITISVGVSVKIPVTVNISLPLQNIDKELNTLKKAYMNEFIAKYNAYDALLREIFLPKIESIKNEILEKDKNLLEEKESKLNELAKEYYNGPHLTVDQQQLYYSLELPERSEFVKLGILTSTDEGLIDVYQKCLDFAIKRKTLAEQQKQTSILDETKQNAIAHQKVVESQNEDMKMLQAAQVYAEEEAARVSRMQASLAFEQNLLMEKQNKELKKQTKLMKKQIKD